MSSNFSILYLLINSLSFDAIFLHSIVTRQYPHAWHIVRKRFKNPLT